LPLKSASLVIAFDRSIAGMAVGTLTGGATTLNPCGGAGATTLGASTFGGDGAFFGFGGSGFGFSISFFGGGGSSFLTATKLTFSSFTFSALLMPARAVAKTARKMIDTCNIMLKRAPPTDRPFLSGLDSSNRILIAPLVE